MSPLIAIAACAVINRARGDDRWMKKWGLRGRALFYVAPAMGLVALLVVQDAFLAAIWAIGYLIWAAPAWGHLIGLGRHVPDRPPSRLEIILLEISAGNVRVALWLRMLFALPAFAAVAWLTELPAVTLGAPVFAALAVGAYEAAWRWRPSNPIWIAELIVGVAWGGAVVTLGGSP